MNAYAFSDEYEPYYPHITAVTRSVDDIYARISNTTAELPEEVVKARKEMIQMYKDVGIDVSLDMENWLASYRMISDFPQRWSEETPIPLGESPDYSGAFSVDAAWNNKIPEDAPRVLVPRTGLSFSIHICAEGQCGVNAANCVTNAYTIKSSEISSTTEMFNHALGGVIDQTDYDLVTENSGQAYTDANKIYDVKQDKELTPADIEIMYYDNYKFFR